MEYKIALGFGNNTDYELNWDSEIIEKCITEFKIFDSDIINIKEINSERNLVIALLLFLKQGIGGEFTVNNTQILLSFAERFKYQITIGGTCPRAAIAMNKLGYKSCMHLVVMNKKIQNLLPKGCEFVCSNDEENYDVHLIFQYTKNTIIKKNDISIKTNRANRIIIGNNNINSQMNISTSFFEKFVNKAKVLMISGFNTMTDQKLLSKRLDLLQKELKIAKSNNIKIYYEDACFISEESNQLCKDILFKYVDVFSFNEDEMQTYYGKQVDLLDAELIAYVLEKFINRFNVPTLIVHSKYWAIAYGKDSISYKDCLKGGVTMATTRFRFGENFNSRNQYIETYNLPSEKIGENFANKFNSIVGKKGFCIPSVKVKETKVTTVGLGDAFVGGFLPPLSEME